MASLATSAQPASLCARRGAVEVPRLSHATRRGAALCTLAAAAPPKAVPAPGAAAGEAARGPLLAARMGVAAPELPPLPLAARRGAAAEVPPLSLAARRGMMGAPCLQSTAEEVKPKKKKPAPDSMPQASTPQGLGAAPAASLAARRGLAAPGAQPLGPGARRGTPAEAPLPLGLGSEPCSPTLSELSTCSGSWPGDDPGSPSTRSDLCMEDWGFAVCEELGHGSSAFVQRVTRRCDGRELAAKCVRSSEQEQLKALEDEYRLLRSLCHRSVVRVETFFRVRLGACLCMELCGGGSVGDYVEAHGAFEEARALELTLQLLEAVDHLHRKRVVHRDVKPANLLLLPGATRLKLGDFGSARRVGSAAGGGAMLSDRGTQLYSAPELRFGLQWNERVDIWASGLCAFVLLRAALPFDGGSRAAARLLHAGRLPKVAWGGTGPLSRSLVRQCLTVEMRDRPTAMELLLHPAFENPCPDGAAAAAPVPDTRGAGAARAPPPACGLVASPAGRAKPPASAARGPWEQALRQLARNRYLRTLAEPLPERPATHSCPF